MKRSPIERRTPLKRSGSLKRTAPRQRSRKPKSNGVAFTDKVKQRVRVRSGGRCEVGAPGCTGRIEQHHHRKMRSQGGKGTLSNCLGVCHSCHHLIHHAPMVCFICRVHHPRWVYEHGLLVPASLEPYQRLVNLEPLDFH